jgi:hypothetical protein
MAMRDSIRRIFVPGLFCSVIAAVWTLGAVKADLDGPSDAKLRVDPAIVRAAMMADPGVEPESLEMADAPGGMTYIFAS